MKKLLFRENEGNYRQTWAWAVPILVFAFFIVGQILALLPAKYSGIITKDNLETYPYILYMLAGSFGMVALIIWAWVRFFERRSLASIGLGRSAHTKRWYGIGFGLGLGMGIAVVCGIRFFGGYGVEDTLNFGFSDFVPIFLLMLCFMLQSGTEEVIFRGWMLNRLSARYGVVVGVLGNSALFCLMHVDGTVMAMSTVMVLIFVATCFLFSVFLSLMVIREKSVWGACAWHAAWNWVFITWFGLPTTGIELGLTPLLVDLMPAAGASEWLTGGITGPEGSVITLVVLLAGCLFYARSLSKMASAEA